MNIIDKCIKEYYSDFIKEIDIITKSSDTIIFNIPSINKSVEMALIDKKVNVYEKPLSLGLNGFRYSGTYKQEVKA